MRSFNYTLTDAKLKALKPQAGTPRKVTDGGGLFVRVSAGGTKAWAYAYAFKGKAKDTSENRHKVIDFVLQRYSRPKSAAPPRSYRQFARRR